MGVLVCFDPPFFKLNLSYEGKRVSEIGMILSDGINDAFRSMLLTSLVLIQKWGLRNNAWINEAISSKIWAKHTRRLPRLSNHCIIPIPSNENQIIIYYGKVDQEIIFKIHQTASREVQCKMWFSAIISFFAYTNAEKYEQLKIMFISFAPSHQIIL